MTSKKNEDNLKKNEDNLKEKKKVKTASTKYKQMKRTLKKNEE
jgi:hypothetical protein